jgi:alkanesulfonate monooxygenase SsuD/methylene tetrahydromethanopterin reductase-like flavin-dependent oxidoreductase (luciferase family)
MHGEGRHGPKIAFRRGRTHVWVGAGGDKEAHAFAREQADGMSAVALDCGLCHPDTG